MNTPIETLEATVCGTRTRVLRVVGQGAAPVVLVHGLGLSADVWRPHMRPLSTLASVVVAPDLPGFGRSPGPLLGMGPGAVADWLLALRDTLDLAPPAWIGHSVASQAVVRLAATSPQHAAAIVLASPTGDTGPLRWLSQLGGIVRTAPREPAWLVRSVAAHYLTNLPTRTIGTWLAARRHDPIDDAPAVRCPTLILLGSDDPVVPVDFVRRLRDAIPGAELHRVPGAAHGAALSHRSAFVERVSLFLRPITHSDRRPAARSSALACP